MRLRNTYAPPAAAEQKASGTRDNLTTPPDGRDIGSHGVSEKGGDCFSEKYPESTYEDPVPDPRIRLPPDTRVGLILLKPILQHYNDYRCKYSPPTNWGQDRDGQRDTTESSETLTLSVVDTIGNF